jgi:hypothetical protein
VLLPPGRRASLFELKVVAAYLGGTASGALLTGLAAWIVSGFAEPLPGPARSAMLVGGAALIWLAKEGPLRRVVSLPEARRQIPAQVFGGSLVRGAYRFGFELGTGVRTYVPSAAPYILVVGLVLTQPALGAVLLAGLGFGLGRAIPLIVQLASGDRLRFANELFLGTRRVASTTAGLVVLIGALSLV